MRNRHRKAPQQKSEILVDRASVGAILALSTKLQVATRC
jgi:hypothetical protein